MSAQSVRLNTTASNPANADSVSGDPTKVYRARHPLFGLRSRPAWGLTRVPLPSRYSASPRTRRRRRLATSRWQSAGGRRGQCLCAERQCRRGDGGHDFRFPRVPEQRRSHEHLERDAPGNAAARPVAEPTQEEMNHDKHRSHCRPRGANPGDGKRLAEESHRSRHR